MAELFGPHDRRAEHAYQLCAVGPRASFVRDMPHDCSAFGKRCTPDAPLGATMVSAEGACAAYCAHGRTGGARKGLPLYDERAAERVAT